MEDMTADILEDCKRGSRKAQLGLYRLYSQKLYVTCLRIVGNRVEAEEAMQDSFLKIYSHIEQYSREMNFEAWIRRIAIHTSIDYIRKQTVEWEELSNNMAAIDGEDEGYNAEAEEKVEFTVERIKEASQKLPSGYRTVLSLYLFEGYDMEEISSILDLQPSSVRTQYMRAKRKLLEILKDN